jgi:molecular chaperone HscC
MIVGIDLGTTHSLIGIFDGNAPRLIPNALGELLTPSAVSVGDGGKIIVGRAASDRLVSHPESSVAAFKRWMGTPRETRLGEHRFRPEELSALVLRSLLADAEANVGQKIEEAVISVPAYFGDAQRKATRAAGELAGIRVERLINEPTAAALAYGLQERLDGSTFMVLDLGGGTFDVSILETFAGVMQVRSSAGDNQLGGEDFLQVLVDACLRDIKLDKGRLSRIELGHVYARLNELKHRLSGSSEASVELALQGRAQAWRIDEQRFGSLVEPLVQRLRAPIERALRDARLSTQQLQEVVLVGGASRMPVFTHLVARMLGRLPLRHVSPDQAIALGACIAAGMKERNAALEEIVMTDVCPYTLGIETSRTDEQGQRTQGHFSPIIERNTTVPCSRAQIFTPLQDGQATLRLRVFQGESPLVAHNVLLGTLDIPLLPNAKREQGAVETRFTYDINGVLQVEAILLATKLSHELILQNNPGVLSEEEIRARLSQLGKIKVHPREDQENIAIIARCERLYEELLQYRQILQNWLAKFLGIVEQQDRDAINRHREELSKALDQIEGSAG